MADDEIAAGHVVPFQPLADGWTFVPFIRDRQSRARLSLLRVQRRPGRWRRRRHDESMDVEMTLSGVTRHDLITDVRFGGSASGTILTHANQMREVFAKSDEPHSPMRSPFADAAQSRPPRAKTFRLRDDAMEKFLAEHGLVMDSNSVRGSSRWSRMFRRWFRKSLSARDYELVLLMIDFDFAHDTGIAPMLPVHEQSVQFTVFRRRDRRRFWSSGPDELILSAKGICVRVRECHSVRHE